MKQRLSVLALLAVILSAPSIAAGEPGWPKSIAIGTASPGGTYYVYGQALADILSGELGIEVTAEATQGSTRNTILLETGQATLDRKSTRLNSSHITISYAVFCF